MYIQMEQKISLKNYVKNGYTISKPLLDEKNIHLIRDLLDKEFKNTEKKKW